MATYRAPLRDMSFVLRELAGIADIAELPGFGDAAEVLDAVLTEAAAFAADVLDPINASGDRDGCTFAGGNVTMPPGFKDAYRRFAQAGWIGFPVPQEYGGQGLPRTLLAPVYEMWNAANVGFANGPLLNQGVIEALELAGSPEQKQTYIPRLVSGEWAGTMCLTEPQAGSDLAAVRTRAVPEGDRYRISGQKIFITFGEHDLTANIVHLVLARLPDAPEGTKGISMFIVPKFLVNADGSPGERNDVSCAGIEHKLGLNANPTCTLNYGERGGGAIGYLVGEPNRGLEYMFIMMNAARFFCGIQGLALADRAYQSALAYAKERVQSRDVASRSPEPVAIVKHPDVRRMLLSMKSQIEAMRALAYVAGAALDRAEAAPGDAERRRSKAFAEFMIPVVKGWCTETAIDLCSTALQVFGGMGYIEETGIAQQYRDVRIGAIYEGTTGIQALDLVGRKLIRDMGETATAIAGEIAAFAGALGTGDPDLAAIKTALAAAVATLGDASTWIGMNAMSDLHTAFACSVPYLKLWGIVAGGWQMARAAEIAVRRIAAADADTEFYRAKLATARFYAEHVLSQSAWLGHQIVAGSAQVVRLSDAAFDLDRRTLANA